MFNPEKPRTYEKSPEVLNKEKLDGCLRLQSAELKERNIPVTGDGQIDMDYFRDKKIYPETDIINDQKEVDRLEKEKFKVNERFGYPEAEGEEFEKLALIIFHKYLGDNFVAVRTSRYDDIKNGVDTLIIEKKTGNVVCALDEIESNDPKKVIEKKENINRKNERGGAYVKYGLRFSPGKEELIYGAISNIPLFMIAIPERNFESELNNLNSSLKEKTSSEQIFFKKLAELCKIQIVEMKKKTTLNETLKNRVIIFEKLLEKINSN